MKRIIATAVAVTLVTSIAYAAPKPAAKAPAAQAQAAAPAVDAAKQDLINSLTGLRNQEIRAAVVQQLLNEEVAKLMSVQEQFCKKYKLDVDKWRKGVYVYDERAGGFVERPQAPAAPAPAGK